jgi:pyruvate/2-oxoglutarate dehydrogenase complex dihydrolipoamide acyltransferase (E2) component
MYILRMPRPDENSSEITIIRWLASIGDVVVAPEDLVECVADKGEFMVYAEQDGVLRSVFAPANSVVPVGYALAAIGAPEEVIPDIEAENAALLERTREQLSATQGLVQKKAQRVRATPAARRLAKELGVDLAAVAATKPGALVKEEDVRGYSP